MITEVDEVDGFAGRMYGSSLPMILRRSVPDTEVVCVIGCICRVSSPRKARRKPKNESFLKVSLMGDS
jgi:hypothetical protein